MTTEPSAYDQAMALAAEAAAAEEAEQAAPEPEQPETPRDADTKPAGYYLRRDTPDDEYRAALAEYGFHLQTWRHQHGPKL
ncbi:hypothetical protein [Streptomyces sp. NPDC001435]|uniref:hypothetical protein n=1 Tax=Streptomyces sp. NPDC001435 TaxID=3364576 RepID=UPI0036CED4BD